MRFGARCRLERGRRPACNHCRGRLLRAEQRHFALGYDIEDWLAAESALNGVERWSTPLLLLTLERTAPIEMTLIKEHARELLDAGPDAMVIADCDGSIVYVNDQTEKRSVTPVTS